MYNEAKKASNAAYLSKFKPVSLRLLPEELAEIQAAAAAAGLSTHKYIIGAVQARMSGKYDKEPEPVVVEVPVDDGMLTPAAREIAIQAAAEVGRPVPDWITHAIQEQHKCESGSKDLNALAAYYKAKKTNEGESE